MNSRPIGQGFLAQFCCRLASQRRKLLAIAQSLLKVLEVRAGPASPLWGMAHAFEVRMRDGRSQVGTMIFSAGLLAGTVLTVGCGNASGSAAATGAVDVADGAARTLDASGDFGAADSAADAGSTDAEGPPALTLSIDPALDQPDDDVKATSITDAKLLDEKGTVKASAVRSAGNAVFPLQGVAAGDYFIEINGDASDLVPTRVDDPTSSLVQSVGQKLRASYVGPASSPTYRINTRVPSSDTPTARSSRANNPT